MNRFERGAKLHKHFGGVPLTIAVFATMFLLFWFGLERFSLSSQRNQLESATMAVTRAVMQCYAIEGAYPESYTYLKENYGIIINEDKYRVVYDCFASNIMPTITVLPR